MNSKFILTQNMCLQEGVTIMNFECGMGLGRWGRWGKWGMGGGGRDDLCLLIMCMEFLPG